MVNETLLDKAVQWSVDLDDSDSSNFVSTDLAESLMQDNQLPSELDDEDQAQWNEIQEQSKGAVDFITRFSKFRDVNSTHAANRYNLLRKLREKHPSNARFMLLLAECNFLMEDTFGGLLPFKQAHEVLQASGVDDPVLERAIAHIQVMAQFEIEDADAADPEDQTVEHGGVEVFPYSRPPNWDPSSTPSDLDSLQIKWAELQVQDDGAKQFARLACVTTNELEGVFNLTGDSQRGLLAVGSTQTRLRAFPRQAE